MSGGVNMYTLYVNLMALRQDDRGHSLERCILRQIHAVYVQQDKTLGRKQFMKKAIQEKCWQSHQIFILLKEIYLIEFGTEKCLNPLTGSKLTAHFVLLRAADAPITTQCEVLIKEPLESPPPNGTIRRSTTSFPVLFVVQPHLVAKNIQCLARLRLRRTTAGPASNSSFGLLRCLRQLIDSKLLLPLLDKHPRMSR